jgi:hypothetical protein
MLSLPALCPAQEHYFLTWDSEATPAIFPLRWVLGWVPLDREGRYLTPANNKSWGALGCVAKDLTRRRGGSWIWSWVRSGDLRWRRKILRSPLTQR